MILLHRSVRIPLFILAGISVAAGLALVPLAAANGFPLALVWRILLALAVAAVAMWLGLRHVAPAEPRREKGAPPSRTGPPGGPVR